MHHPTEAQTEAAEAGLAADIAAMAALAERTNELSSALEAAVGAARRREASAALDEAFGLVEDAYAALAGGLLKLRGIDGAAIAGEIIDAADAARAEARRIAA